MSQASWCPGCNRPEGHQPLPCPVRLALEQHVILDHVLSIEDKLHDTQPKPEKTEGALGYIDVERTKELGAKEAGPLDPLLMLGIKCREVERLEKLIHDYTENLDEHNWQRMLRVAEHYKPNET